jgi:hypothetical protein
MPVPWDLGIKRREASDGGAIEVGARPPDATGPPARDQWFARRALILLGIVYLVAQLGLFTPSRPPRWDEAVYLSQVIPGMEAVFFMASRSRGISLLVAPVTSLGGSIGDVRLYLTVLSAVAMTATYRTWVPVVGMAAPLAALVFSFSWLGLVSGSEVMPNYWAAILGLAAAGLTARRLQGEGTRYIVLASLVLAAMALVRPTDATVLAGVIVVIVLSFRRDFWGILMPLGLGLVLGWLPWVVEMSVRFDGPANAVRAAAAGRHFASVQVTENLIRHATYVGGKGSGVPIAGMMWWGLIVTMAIVALALRREGETRSAMLLCGLGAVAFAAGYIVFVPALPRFLLPAYAFASVPFAAGCVSLLRGGTASRIAGGTVLVLMIPWVIWQSTVADDQERGSGSHVAFRVGTTIRERAGGRPCYFVSPREYPQVAVASRCEGERGSGAPSAAEVEELQRRGREVFVILLKRAPRASPLSSLTPVRFIGANRTWFLYHLPTSTG